MIGFSLFRLICKCYFVAVFIPRKHENLATISWCDRLVYYPFHSSYTIQYSVKHRKKDAMFTKAVISSRQLIVLLNSRHRFHYFILSLWLSNDVIILLYFRI